MNLGIALNIFTCMDCLLIPLGSQTVIKTAILKRWKIRQLPTFLPVLLLFIAIIRIKPQIPDTRNSHQ